MGKRAFCVGTLCGTVFIAAAGWILLSQWQVPLSLPGGERQLLRSQITMIGHKEAADVYRVLFPAGTFFEILETDKIYLVSTPDSSDVIQAPLDLTMTIGSGTGHDVNFFGYKYTSADAATEKLHKAAPAFVDRFPGQFFASQKARAEDAAQGGGIAAFETKNGITMLPTTGTSAVLLERNTLYMLVINETTPVIVTIHPSVCGDGARAGDELCDDGDETDGDGCSALCQIEAGWVCHDEPVTQVAQVPAMRLTAGLITSAGWQDCVQGFANCTRAVSDDGAGNLMCGAGTLPTPGLATEWLSMGLYCGNDSCEGECFRYNNTITPLCGNGEIQAEEQCELGGSNIPLSSVGGATSADVNGDTMVDIIALRRISSTSTASVLVALMGNGDGTFQFPKESSLGGDVYTSQKILSGDFDGDGETDVLFRKTVLSETTGEYLQNYYVARGNGDGTFQAPVLAFPSNPDVSNLQAGDVNGDGIQDLLVSFKTGSGPSTVISSPELFFGSVGLSFVSQHVFTADKSYAALLQDFDGDGHLDIAFRKDPFFVDLPPDNPGGYPDYWELQTVAVFYGMGDGTFTEVDISMRQAVNGTFSTKDVNFDGLPDLLVPDIFNGSAYYLSSGNRTWTAMTNPPTDFGEIMADFNGDGIQDILTPNGDGAGILGLGIRIGQGGGTFTSVVGDITAPDTNVWSTFATDLNGDGRSDIVVSGGMSGGEGIWTYLVPCTGVQMCGAQCQCTDPPLPTSSASSFSSSMSQSFSISSSFSPMEGDPVVSVCEPA
jgi:cysteine-rich repeat protein